MKITCKSNDIYSYEGAILEFLIEATSQSQGVVLPLTPNKEYVVYGIEIIDGYPFYYICDDLNETYPWPYPSPLFEVSDVRVSRYWSYKHKVRLLKSGVDIYTHFTFKEWLDDECFADKLLDGEAHEISTFQKYKNKFDSEEW